MRAPAPACVAAIRAAFAAHADAARAPAMQAHGLAVAEEARAATLLPDLVGG